MRTLAGLLLLALSAVAQTEFDAVSIKPYDEDAPGGRHGGPGTGDPTRIGWNDAGLSNLIVEAYHVAYFQIVGPKWLGEAQFAIAARVPPDTTQEQLALMWRHLLEERFHLRAPLEKREMTVHDLAMGKGGHKLQDPPAAEAAMPDDAHFAVPKRLESDGKGCFQMPITLSLDVKGSHLLCAKHMTMEELARRMSNALKRPVYDKTGLAGRYDFRLMFDPGDSAVSDKAPQVADAVRRQLGLELVSRKAPVDFVIVDSIDKTPTEN